MKHITVLLATVILAMATSCKTAKDTDLVNAGDAVPEFSLSSDVYGDISSADLKGKVTYLCFFATWCPPWPA